MRRLRHWRGTLRYLSRPDTRAEELRFISDDIRMWFVRRLCPLAGHVPYRVPLSYMPWTVCERCGRILDRGPRV